MSKMARNIYIVLAISLIGLGVFFVYGVLTGQKDDQAPVNVTKVNEQPNEEESDNENQKEKQNEEQEETPSVIERAVNVVTRKTEEVTNSLRKADLSYDVPFTSQAPYGNWDHPYDEACEEASMIMVDAFYRDKTLTPAVADQMIVDAVEWQTQSGYTVDITAAETVEVLADYYDLDGELIYNPTVEDITGALAGGDLVIVPAAGRQLGNPYFTPPGPIYHMLVITGYDDSAGQFVTNDPGTRRGEGFRYSYDVLMNAIHDWNGGNVNSGQKVIIVVKKP